MAQGKRVKRAANPLTELTYQQGAAMVRRHLDRTVPVAAVSHFLVWLGTGQPVTTVGVLRRSDIQPVTAMLGLNIAGKGAPLADTAELLPNDVSDEPPAITSSMNQVGELASWWAALQKAGLITVLKTKVKPGPGAATWEAEESDEPGPALQSRITLLTTYLTSLLMYPEESARADYFTAFAAESTRVTVELIVDALREDPAAEDDGADTAAGAEAPDQVPADPAPADSKLPGFTKQALTRLATDRIIAKRRNPEPAEYRVPAGLRVIVAESVMDVVRRHQ